MTRSKQKSPQVNLLQKTKIISRYSEILPNFIGQTFKVHCGNKYTEILVKENMIGHKFGEFSFTRKNFISKKKLKNGSKN